MAVKKKEKKESAQKTLFGEQDFVYNVLQTDIADISDDIESSRKRIEKIEKHITEREEQRETVLKASRIVEKQRREAEAAKVEEERDEDKEKTEQQVEDEKTEPEGPDEGDKSPEGEKTPY